MDFLTTPWFDAVQANLDTNEQLRAAAANMELSIQQVVTDVPGGGEIRHNFTIDHGAIHVGLGAVENPDATLTASYASAAAMNRGELDMMSAFAGGKVLLNGDLMVLMQNQATLSQMNAAFEAVRDGTTYAS